MEGPDGTPGSRAKVNQVLTFEGLERVQATRPARATSC
jgi:hypothetical protein